MTTIEYLALFGMPIFGMLFLIARGATAWHLSLVVMFGWLLLPIHAVKFALGYPIYDKAVAVDLAVLMGLMMVRPVALLGLKPNWVDAAMAAWCLVPFGSSVTNELGWYDGASAAFRQFVVWGVPYVIGRAVLVTKEDVVAFAKV